MSSNLPSPLETSSAHISEDASTESSVPDDAIVSYGYRSPERFVRADVSYPRSTDGPIGNVDGYGQRQYKVIVRSFPTVSERIMTIVANCDSVPCQLLRESLSG